MVLACGPNIAIAIIVIAILAFLGFFTYLMVGR